MKVHHTKISLTFFLLLFSIQLIFSQCLLKEIPLEQQIKHSNLVIEGTVINQKSFWDENRHNIYTVNTIEVFKVFKGDAVDIVEVITRGGRVGSDIEIVTPSLELKKNAQGVFMLNNINSKNNLTQKSESGRLRVGVYSGVQGFYKYDLFNNKAKNVFNEFQDIKEGFHEKVKTLSNKNIIQISENVVFNKITNFNKSSSSNKAVAITNINPTTITAGTKSVLTIEGSGFGNTSGVIGFRDADTGGTTLTSEILSPPDGDGPLPIDTQIISWTDTRIEVEVPSKAGTGPVTVFHNSDLSSAVSQTLTINYALLNSGSEFLSSGTEYQYQNRHINDNGSGGYTWRMFTDFDANTAAKESFMRAFDRWRCETGVNWIIGATTSVDVIANDGTNVIRFGNGNEVETEYGAGTLGVCINRISVCGFPNMPSSGEGYVVEMDIVFDEDFNWQFGETSPSGNEVDFESVALHELGHGHQLAHVIDANAIMHFNFGSGVENRLLSQNDIDAANNVQSRSETAGNCLLPMTAYDKNLCSLGLEKEDLASAISIFPNPATNEFFIKNDAFFNLEKAVIYDISGRQVSEYDLSETSRIKGINVQNYSKGVYIVSIHSDNAPISKKLILE